MVQGTLRATACSTRCLVRARQLGEERPLHRERLFYHVVGVNLLVNASAAIVRMSGCWSRRSILGNGEARCGASRCAAQCVQDRDFPFPRILRSNRGPRESLPHRPHAWRTVSPTVSAAALASERLRRFVEGWYESQGSKMYVNRGLGMSNLPIRFCAAGNQLLHASPLTLVNRVSTSAC